MHSSLIAFKSTFFTRLQSGINLAMVVDFLRQVVEVFGKYLQIFMGFSSESIPRTCEALAVDVQEQGKCEWGLSYNDCEAIWVLFGGSQEANVDFAAS
jgi:hypothetical protein